MNMYVKTGIVAVVLVALLGGGLLAMLHLKPAEQPVNTATFSCDQGKSITAAFYTSRVSLVLSDGRKEELPQAISASGARYTNADESFVFWNKGNTAFITEGKTEPQTQTYANCVTAGDTPQQEALLTFASSTLGYSFQYPKGYTINPDYAYDQFGPKKLVHGVKVIIPADMATGTNLSSFDTGVSVEQLPHAKKCTADIYLTQNVKAQTVDDAGVTYSLASTSDAGAGNLYNEIVYAFPTSKPCTAVRYFIHSTNIGNYPPGAVTEFDRAALLAQFDAIRQSILFTAAQ